MNLTNIALALLATAQLADVVTTIQALKRGGVEANPVVKFLMDKFGKGWVLVKLAVTAGAAYLLWSLGMSEFILGLAAITGLVAYHNTRVAK